MNAIPTHYNGVNYRSRLEAKWANFFDLIGWRHEYEPFDLNGYIPDFVIKFAKMPVYVEVKPSMTISDLQIDCQKARLATLGKRLLCLGGSIDLPSDYLQANIGIQAVRLNLCDQDFADTSIRAFGKGNPNHEEWDLEDKSTEMCVIGYWEESELRQCPGCQVFFPNCYGYSSCPECGMAYASRCVDRANQDCVDRYIESVQGVRAWTRAKWKEAGNTTQYKRIFLAK